MKQYTWDEYYDKFYDWAESTRVKNLSGLASLGPADEVGEIIMELQWNSVSAANRLLKKAVEAKLVFSASDLTEFFSNNDEALATAALYNSANRLTSEDMEELYTFAEDDDIIKICKKYKLTLPEDLREEEEEIEEEIEEEPLKEVTVPVDGYIPKKPKKLGLFASLFAAKGASDAINKSRLHKHNGKCDGDCANCPPHYGYRYGRWYYGHDHFYGCEFGGNKGSGSMD